MSDLVAVILAAGVGRRFSTEPAGRPKALLEVGGETLLDRLIRQLAGAGVRRVAVVVGHGGDRIAEALARHPDVEVLWNPDYRRGAILSLWCARVHLGGPVLVMDADVFGPDELVARLVRSPHESCFLLDGRCVPSGEEQMLMVCHGRVVDIARKPRGAYDLLGESIGFLKLSPPRRTSCVRFSASAWRAARSTWSTRRSTRSCLLGSKSGSSAPTISIDRDRFSRRPGARAALRCRGVVSGGRARRRLIVNGDDFGLTAEVNRGIIRAHREGILTSTSLMVTSPAVEQAVLLARETPSLAVGLHLVLVQGRAALPPSARGSVARRDGSFPTRRFQPPCSTSFIPGCAPGWRARFGPSSRLFRAHRASSSRTSTDT